MVSTKSGNAHARLTTRTIFGFLLGKRKCIAAVAQCRGALWLGLAFVLSAGLAREYDGEDLLREPWHLLLPLAASLATSLILYRLIITAARIRHLTDLQFWRGYRTFLTCYWMTAPLAWLYAIPVERFLSPGDAVLANLYLLAVVSAWRVALITRVVVVWFNASWLGVFPLVMLFGDSVLLILSVATPTPIWAIMGGIRISPAETVILSAKQLIWFFGTVTWPLWLIWSIVAVVSKGPHWSLASDGNSAVTTVSRATRGLAVTVIFFLACWLPLTQPEQQRRSHAERLLKSGELAEAVAYMSQFDVSDFPPLWDPPPRVGYGENEPELTGMIPLVQNDDVRPWVRDAYVGKFAARSPSFLQRAIQFSDEIDEEAVKSFLDIMQDADAPAVGDYQVRELLTYAANDKELDPELKERINQYLNREWTD